MTLLSSIYSAFNRHVNLTLTAAISTGRDLHKARHLVISLNHTELPPFEELELTHTGLSTPGEIRRKDEPADVERGLSFWEHALTQTGVEVPENMRRFVLPTLYPKNPWAEEISSSPTITNTIREGVRKDMERIYRTLHAYNRLKIVHPLVGDCIEKELHAKLLPELQKKFGSSNAAFAKFRRNPDFKISFSYPATQSDIAVRRPWPNIHSRAVIVRPDIADGPV